MIRFGIIGTNWITERFLKASEAIADFQLTAVYSRTEERARDFAGKYRVENIFTNLEEMAASDTFDAIYIASPNAMHAKQAILFMEHGKHVLCEKPIASNAKEIGKMVETAKKHNVVLMEAMKSTLMPNFRSVEENLHKLGKVRTYFANFCQYSSRYDAYRQGTVLNAFNPALSNGALMDLGVYTIYPLVVLFGKPNTIKATGCLLDSGADGLGSILFSYDEMEAVVMYSKITSSPLPSEILGEDGSIVIHHISGPEKIEFRTHDGSLTDISREQSQDSMYYEIKEFMGLIEDGKLQSTKNSWETSITVMEIIDEARRQIGIVYPNDFDN